MTDKKNDKKNEESVPVEEVKIPKTVSVGHVVKSMVVLLISFVCILIGVSIYQVYSPLDKFHLVQPESKKEVETLPVIPVVKKDLPIVANKEPVLRLENNETPALEPVPLFEGNPEPEEIPSVVEESEVAPAVAEPKNDLALSDVLELRDQLATGKNCLDSFQKIMKHQLDPSLKEKLMLELMPVCTNRSLYPEMKATFGKNKKAALYTYYSMKNPKWLAAVKSVLTTLVDVRRLNPQKAKPKDFIYQAQNALMACDLEKSLSAIRKLPPEIQSDFNDYIQSVSLYLTAQKSADQLVFQFDRKGE